MTLLVPPWFDAAAREALRSKEAAFRRLRREPCEETRRAFSEKRSVLKSICSSRYSKYLMDLVDSFRSNPKRYWTFLKCFSKKGSIHPVLRDGDMLVSDDVARASLLNRTFASKFSDPKVTVYPPTTRHDLPPLNHITVPPDRVCAILSQFMWQRHVDLTGSAHALSVSAPANCPCLWQSYVICHCNKACSHSNGNRQT